MDIFSDPLGLKSKGEILRKVLTENPPFCGEEKELIEKALYHFHTCMECKARLSQALDLSFEKVSLLYTFYDSPDEIFELILSLLKDHISNKEKTDGKSDS